MNQRKEYTMSQSDLDKILEACRPVPMIMLQCGAPSSPQENANRAWEELGKRMSFDHMTVEPVSGKTPHTFTAISLETEPQRAERESQQKEAELRERIQTLQREIELKQNELAEILTT